MRSFSIVSISLLLALFASFQLSCKKEAEIDCQELMRLHGKNAKAINAVTLNTAGYRLYHKNNYTEALKLFRCSAKYNDNYFFGHYNLACTLGILLGQGKDVDKDELFYHLKRSLELKPSKINKIISDPDLDSVRESDRYKDLISRYVTPAQQEKEVVSRYVVPTRQELIAGKEWASVNPETMSWNYIFTDTEYALFPGDLEYLQTDSSLQASIEIGQYQISGNTIILHGRQKEVFVYRGYEERREVDAAGELFVVRGRYFATPDGSSAYMARGGGALRTNKAIIQKLKRLKN